MSSPETDAILPLRILTFSPTPALRVVGPALGAALTGWRAYKGSAEGAQAAMERRA